MLGEAFKQLSGILSISDFKQMILTLMFILYNYASFFVLRISCGFYIVSKFGYNYNMLVWIIKNSEVGSTLTCGIYNI